MATPRYGMVTDIRNMPALSQLGAAGITPLFGGNDPGGVAAIQAAMQAAQGNAGLWIPADNRGVQEYVEHVKQLLAAAPQAKHVDLNIEAIGKGAPGSPGWDYTEQVLRQLEPLLAGRSWSASPMGMQDDFNYGAITSRGGQIWPQAYGGDMSNMDPQAIVEWVRRNKVPAEMITPLLGNKGQAGFGHLYGIDLPGFRGEGGQFGINQNADPLAIPSLTSPPEGFIDRGPEGASLLGLQPPYPSKPTGAPLSDVYLSNTGRGPVVGALKKQFKPKVKKGYQTYAPAGVPFNPNRQIKINAPLPKAFQPIANPYLNRPGVIYG
jgi:hypothetical protein